MPNLNDLLRKLLESSQPRNPPASKKPTPVSLNDQLKELLEGSKPRNPLASIKPTAVSLNDQLKELLKGPQVRNTPASEAITPSEFIRKFGITCFYHFTDTRNLPSIRARGGLLPWTQIKGDVVAPGGNDWSHDADAIKGQDSYVHLCFLPEHPMEFVARKDGRILESRFLRIDSSVIHTPGILFCPDVANKSGVEMMGLSRAVSEMDFDIIALAHKWLDPSLFERKKRACKYELLVPGQIPLSLISGI